jgi:hypothetical protein
MPTRAPRRRQKERQTDHGTVQAISLSQAVRDSLLGVTCVKRAVKRKSGWNAATRITRAPTNMKRTVLRRGGYSSGPMRFWRWLLGKR